MNNPDLKSSIASPDGSSDTMALDPKSQEALTPNDELKRVISAVARDFELPEKLQRQVLEVIAKASKNPEIPPEENPEVLAAVVQLLVGLGYREQVSIDPMSLKLESLQDEQAATINRLVTTGKMPTRHYPSNVGIYCFDVAYEDAGIRYSRSSFGANALTAWAETQLRKSGDHGGSLWIDIFRTPVRTKVGMKQIGENIEALGLQKYFSIEGESILERTEDMKDGFFLDDLLRFQHRHDFLKAFDPEEALKASASMVAKVHAAGHRGIGELLANDIVLQVQDGKINGARLTLPDMQYGEKVDALTQQALDILDICFSIGTAGMQSAGEDEKAQAERARAHIQTFLGTYDQDLVKNALRALLEQGKPHDTMHNRVRFGFDRLKNKKQAFEMLRNIIREAF